MYPIRWARHPSRRRSGVAHTRHDGLVTPAELAFLRSPNGQVLLDALTPYDAAAVLHEAERWRAVHDSSLIAAAMTQARLRTKSVERFGPKGLTLWWTPDTLEQATRPEVSARRAHRLRLGGATRVADLGCGAGLDTVAMAEAGLTVLAIERDPVLVEIARANLEAAGVSHLVDVRCGDARSLDLADAGCDAVFIDPARRADGHRLRHPEQWQPPLSAALDLSTQCQLAVIKVAPGLDHTLVPDTALFEAVSFDGRLVEAALWFGVDGDSVRRRAVVLPTGAVLEGGAGPLPPPATGPWRRWLIEPDDAVIRAGLVGPLADELGGHLVDPRIAYITTDEPPTSSALYARFTVDEVVPFSMKALRAQCRLRAIGRVEVKKRGFAMDPEEVRRGLKLDRQAPNACTVLLTRIGDAPIAVIAHRP